jgi:gliding motility-associated-like protein
LYSSAGTYTKKFTSTAGCDSVATLVLTVNDTVSSITSQTVCANQLPYTWNGQPYNAAGTYTKKLTSAAGCDSTATLILSLINIGCDDIYFPTAISPGGNFNNRTFGALGNLQVVSNYSLSVYNRYGQLVFYTSNPFQKWDGRFKGNHTGNDAFVWFATYTVNGSIKKVQKGTLVVIR